MARRKSFTSLMAQIAREQARAQKAQERETLTIQRNAERNARHVAKMLLIEEKEAKQRYIEERIEETEELNKELEQKTNDLTYILDKTLEIDDTISFESLRIKEDYKTFKLPPQLSKPYHEPELERYLAAVPAPNFLVKIIPGWENRYKNKLEDAEKKFEADRRIYETNIAVQKKEIAALESTYNKEKAAFELKKQQRNLEVDEFEQSYANGEPEAIASYCSMVLERSNYPAEFPQEFRVAYLPDPKELVIDYELPNLDTIPSIEEYRYTKNKDAISEKQRKSTDIKDQYQDVVASICLRTLHEIFEADQGSLIEVVVFNGFVQTVDSSTGHDIRPYLISVRTVKEKFKSINLSRVDKKACLRNLGAQVSPKASEMLPVKPIVEFDMVDKRFIDQSDIMADLESRPNIMELNPYEFENFISNLFERIGFQSKLTRSSRDGGVDAIAFDPRPILGGKVVIQAKRYKNVVGVSAVRDL